jgi:hypothetical protein
MRPFGDFSMDDFAQGFAPVSALMGNAPPEARNYIDSPQWQ